MDEQRKQHIIEFRKRFNRAGSTRQQMIGISDKQAIDVAFLLAGKMTDHRVGKLKRSELVEDLAVRCLADDDFLVAFVDVQITAAHRMSEVVAKLMAVDKSFAGSMDKFIGETKATRDRLANEDLKTKEEGA